MLRENGAGSRGVASILGTGPIALALLLRAAPVHAVDTFYGIGYSAVYSDNIARTQTNPQQDWIHIPRATLILQEAAPDVSARLYSQIEYDHYVNHTFGDELLFGLDGHGEWAITPGSLTFVVDDRFTQAPVIPALSISPGNRQNTNALSLGPDATVRFTAIDSFQTGARYSNIYYQDSPTSNNRLWGYARIVHGLTPITTVSLNYEPSRINYKDDTLNPPYTRQDVFVNARVRHAVTTVSLDAGKTYITRDNTSYGDLQGHLLRATLTRRISSMSSFELSGSDEYSDSGRETITVNPLVQITPAPGAINSTDFVGGGLFAEQRVDAAYIRQRYYGVNRVNLFWRQFDFESPQVLDDQRVGGIYVDYGVDFSSAATVGFFGNYSETSYQSVYRDDKDYIVGARGIYRFARRLSFTLEGAWDGRQSTLPTAEYNERRVVFTVSYDSNYAASVANPFLEQNDPLYR